MADGIYAVLDNNTPQVVVSVVNWDPVEQPGMTFPGPTIEIDSITPQPQVGWTYSNGTFTPPS